MQTIVIDVNNHRHNGELLPVGTQLDVDDSTAAWLIERNKAHLMPTTPEPTKKG